jgi:hypothetical protein
MVAWGCFLSRGLLKRTRQEGEPVAMKDQGDMPVLRQRRVFAFGNAEVEALLMTSLAPHGLRDRGRDMPGGPF